MLRTKPVDKLIGCAYLYLLLPVLLFAVGWLRWYYALPLCVGLLYGFYVSLFTERDDTPYRIQVNWKLWLCLAILLGWVVASGVGGLAWQNRWDHMFRNTVFQDLCANAWPVVNSAATSAPEMMCYYIGFWLPSAVVTKLTGSLTAGYLFQTLYAYAGVVIAFLLLFRWMKAVKLRMVLLFIFFSGLDVVTYWLAAYVWGTTPVQSLNNFFYGHHELYMWSFNSSSNTTLLYWLYNQIVPFWVGGMLLMHNWKHTRTLLFTYSLLMLFSPFPFVALFPLIVYRCLIELKNCKLLFSLPNVVGVLWMGVIALYYAANNNVGKFRLILPEELWPFVVFLVVEFFVFFPFIWSSIKKDRVFWILFATMIIFNVVRFEASDFSWRVTIPVAAYMMLRLMEEVNRIRRFSWRMALFTVVFMLGAVTPISEMRRVVEGTVMVLQGKQTGPLLSPPKPSVFELDACRDNFVSTHDSFFTRYLMKR